MADIIIKGMEMPKTCFECPFMFARRYCCANFRLDLYQGDYEELKGRIAGCPLIPVPDHGRLIDAFDTVKTLCDKGLYMHAEIVSDMPTIIPASKEGE